MRRVLVTVVPGSWFPLAYMHCLISNVIPMLRLPARKLPGVGSPSRSQHQATAGADGRTREACPRRLP